MTMPKVTEITEILNMPKGSEIVYHVGHLSIDRASHAVEHHAIMPRTKAEREAIGDVAILAMRFCDEGKVALAQRRIGEHRYEYMAQRK